MAFFKPGEYVFAPSKSDGWVLGVVVKQKSDTVTVTVEKDEDYEDFEFSSNELVAAPEDSRLTHDNLTDVGELKEAVVLHNLRTRYKSKTFYTYIGPILLAVNPYERLSIYSKKHINMYKSGAKEELPPHVFAIAQEAYKSLRQEDSSQSILVSGESGAGKTETTKLLLQHLAVVSGQNDIMANLSNQILEANPVLEAFGNAKTVNNDNSSRFGKFIKVFFAKNGDVVGGVIEQYLLETTRIVNPNPGERNYHIFYQLCTGCTAKEKQALYLEGIGAESFSYLKASCCPTTIKDVDDGADLHKVRDALKVLGFDKKEIVSIWRVVVAVLHLGNISFTEGERTKVKNPDALQKSAKLFGVEPNALTKALVNRGFQGGNRKSSVAIPLTGAEASSSRDGFSKAIYATLFEWLVHRINQTIHPKKEDPVRLQFIGLLDIFGFESFEHNSLEQLLINGTNETLQYQFNKVFFEHEQQDYKAEGIPWDKIQFRDNTPCVQLIEGQGSGLLPMLCEEGKLPQCSDERLLSKMNQAHRASKFYSIPRKEQTCFEIKHFARTVKYDITGFLEKNVDIVSPEVVALVEDSSSKFLRGLFEIAVSNTNTVGTLRKGAGKRRPTVTEKFLKQLASLSEQLDKTHRHYIRCIRPNKLSQPQLFEGCYALDQMLSSGVMETIMIRKAGFGHRITFKDFAEIYGILLRKRDEEAKSVTKKILTKRLKGMEEYYALGRSKVFLRENAKVHLDVKVDEMRKKAGAILLHAMLRARFKPRFEAVVKLGIEERKKREEEERRRREEEERIRREEEERKQREEKERKQREKEERKKKQKEEAERLRLEEEMKKLDEDRKRLEEEKKRREEEREEKRKRKERELEEMKKEEDERRRTRNEEREEKRKEKEREVEQQKKEEEERRKTRNEEKERRRAETKRRGMTESGTPSKEPKARTTRSTTNYDLGSSPSSPPAFFLADDLNKRIHAFVSMVENQEDLETHKASIAKILKEFMSEAPSISDTRTFSRACKKVNEQAGVVIMAAEEADGSKNLEIQIEMFQKTLNSWKQTALALGKNLSPALPQLSSRSESPAAKKNSANDSRIFRCCLLDDAGEIVCEEDFMGSETALQVKRVLLERIKKQERHHVYYRLRGCDACLTIADNAPSLASVNWIVECLRVGVVPVLEMSKIDPNDSKSHASKLNKLMDVESKLSPILSSVLGTVYEECQKLMSTGWSRGRLLNAVLESNPTFHPQLSVVDRAVQFMQQPLGRREGNGSLLPQSNGASTKLLSMTLQGFKNIAIPEKSTLVVSFFDGPRLLTEPYQVEAKGEFRSKVAVSLLPFEDIPPASRIHVSLTRNSSTLAWGNLVCVDEQHRFIRGKVSFRLWTTDMPDASFAPGQNPALDAPLLEAEFDYEEEIFCEVPTVFSIPNASVPTNLEFANYQKVARVLRRPECGTRSMQLSDAELDLLWDNRLLLSSCAGALPPFFPAVPWAKAKARQEAHALMFHWASPAPVEAVGLLGPFLTLDPVARSLACEVFARMQSTELSSWISLLAVGLRFESNHFSELHKLVLVASVGDPERLGRQLFWALWPDLKIYCLSERAGLVCELLLRWIGASQRDRFVECVELTRKLVNVYKIAVKGKSGWKSVLKEISFRGGSVPVNSSTIRSLLIGESRFDDSSNCLSLSFDGDDAPFYVTVRNEGSGLIALHLVRIMNELWKSKGKDMGNVLYECVDLGDSVVMSSFVGERGVLLTELLNADDKAIARFIEENNHGPDKQRAAKELLSSTAASLCVTSYILGDCSMETLFVLPSGALYQSHHTITDTAMNRFGLFPQIAIALGSNLLQSTVQLAARAFSVVRKNAWIVSTCLTLLTGYETGRTVDKRLMEIRLRLGHDGSKVMKDFESQLLAKSPAKK